MKSKNREYVARKRERIFYRDKGICYYCGQAVLFGQGRADGKNPPHFATLDHIVPRARGGTLCDDNLVLACFSCNNERGDKDARGFMFEKRGLA